MYKTVTIDLQKYEQVYENPTGRIEYYLIDMPKEYTREDKTKFEYKRCIFEPDMHLGEMTAYKAAEKIGIPCCRVELFKRPYTSKPHLFETGIISYYDTSNNDELYASDSIVTRYMRKRGIMHDYMADIDTIFAAAYEKFKQENRPLGEFLKFKKDFIFMTVFDLQFGNFDRGLNNWFIRRNKITGAMDLYPMFDNEAILGFTDEIPEDMSYQEIAEFNNARKSKVTISSDRVSRKYTDFRDLYTYLLSKYPLETRYATKKVTSFMVSDLDTILNNLPDITPERKEFARRNFMYRKMTLEKIYLEQNNKKKVVAPVKFEQRMSS